MKAHKKCKGTGQATGHGCGDPLNYTERNGLRTYDAKFGLGKKCCYTGWLLNSDEGKAKIEKSRLKSEGSTKTTLIKKAEQRKREHKVEEMSLDKYRATYIQPILNHIARIIDEGQPCICTGLPDGKMNGGHRHSTGSNRTLTYNLHNIHNQSFHSNHHQSGDHLKYRVGIKKNYGVEYADYIDETLMQCPSLHLTKEDLIELKPRLERIRRHYEKLKLVYTPKQRIRLRDQLNEEIGIYTEEFASFKQHLKLK